MKTSELTGTALDWAVATCEGEPMTLDPMGFGARIPGGYWVWDDHGCGNPKTRFWQIGSKYSPSTDWSQGGPIIERLVMNGGLILRRDDATGQGAVASLDAPHGFYFGPTPLIAAMRCYVASKLGDEVDVPKENFNDSRP